MEIIEDIEIIRVNYSPNIITYSLLSECIKNDYIKVILSIIDNGVTYYIRIEGNIHNDKCIIFYNGAADINRKDKPIFQRSSWVNEINALVINIDDPTIRLSHDLVLGWGQGTLENYYSEKFNIYLQDILNSFNKPIVNRLHVGSSAGGYQAIVGSSFDVGSKALVLNPQIDWSHHFFMSHADRLRNIAFKNYSFDALKSMYPHRLNCLDMAIANGNIPSIIYYVNTAFAHDIDNQLVIFLDRLKGKSNLLKDKTIDIRMYNNEKEGHNPPLKDKTIKIINNALDSFVSRLNIV